MTKPSLSEISRLFLRLGATSFGGPAVHIAMMEDEVVRRRGWLSSEEFLDLVAATNFIPGPNSTEMAIHIGYRRAGLAGLIVAGGSFIAPAVVIVLGISWCYQQYGALPVAGAILYGIKPAVLAVVLQALWRLGKTALKSRFLLVLGAAATAANLLGAGEIAVLAAGGLIAAAGVRFGGSAGLTALTLTPVILRPGPVILGAAAASSGAAAVGISKIFLLFLKVGSVLFGSGYVLLSFLRADLVEKLQWMTDAQLLDAVAIGQVTPGPVFTTATFIGYQLAGTSGALAATVGIFLPAFVFVAVTAPFISRMRNSKVLVAALDGLNAASLALMAVVSFRLGWAAVVDPATIAIFIIGVFLLLRWKVNSMWLVLLGAVAGISGTLL